MIEKCPECNEKIDILPQPEPNPPSAPSFFTATTTIDYTLIFPPTSKTYKCSNPKCWVTKITERWE